MRKVKPSKVFGKKLGKFEIAKLEIHPGDILVLRTDLHLTLEQVEQLRDRAQREFGYIKVVILSGGLSLAVVQDKRAARG